MPPCLTCLCGSWVSNSGPHACAANTLAAEPSFPTPHPSKFIHSKCILKHILLDLLVVSWKVSFPSWPWLPPWFLPLFCSIRMTSLHLLALHCSPCPPAGMVPGGGWVALLPPALLPLKDGREDERKNKQSVCFLVLK